MSRFDRKVERQKSEFIFSKKVIPEKTKGEMIKENFSFKWIKINFKTVIYLIIDFIFVSIVFIPFLITVPVLSEDFFCVSCALFVFFL